MCVSAGLVDAGVVAIDGTKIAANASFFANRDRESLTKELAELNDATQEIADQVLAEAEATDAAEDAELGQARGGQMPAQWSGGRGRRDRIRAALGRAGCPEGS